jgi:hypothetical protein
MAIYLPFDIPNINEQYTLYGGDRSRGLLKTLDLYLANKNSSGDYDFGVLTEKYNQFSDGGAHWRHSVALFREVHAVLKPIIIFALTNEIEIDWEWDANPDPDYKKGVRMTYDAVGNKFHITIFGFHKPK